MMITYFCEISVKVLSFPYSVFVQCYFFSGILLGIAIRTGSPLSLSIAEPVWKQLAGMPLGVSDLTEVDKDYVPGKFVCNSFFL